MMRLRISHRNAIFFVGITMILFTRSHSRSFYSSSSQPQNEFYAHGNERADLKAAYLQQSFVNVNTTPVKKPNREVSLKCELELPKFSKYDELSAILSDDIFSQTDPFSYIFAKTMEISINHYPYVKSVVDETLEKNLLPLCYIPYANLLASFLRCWIHFANANRFIKAIETRRVANEDGFDASPLDMYSSSVELSQIFSPDIFSDPVPPMRLFHKLLNMSSNQIANLRIQLENFQQKWWGKQRIDIPFPIWYVWYSKPILTLLYEKHALEDLKRNMVEIQRKSTLQTGTIAM